MTQTPIDRLRELRAQAQGGGGPDRIAAHRVVVDVESAAIFSVAQGSDAIRDRHLGGRDAPRPGTSVGRTDDMYRPTVIGRDVLPAGAPVR